MPNKLEEIPIEIHPLKPFLPPQASLLMLGSFPPQQKDGQWIFIIRIGITTCGVYGAIIL